jgi:hypothetical protein
MVTPRGLYKTVFSENESYVLENSRRISTD